MLMNSSYIKDWFGRWAGYTPNKTAVKDFSSGKGMTYAEIDKAAQKVALYFQRNLGLKYGDRVAVLSDFNLNYIILLAVAQKTGIILLPLNYRLSGRELDYLLENAGASACVVSDSYATLLKDSPHYWICQHRLSMDELSSVANSRGISGFKGVEIEEDHPLFILYTSGTTGFPKGAIYTHKMAFWNAVSTGLRLDLTSADHTVICMPPFHTGGWNVFLTPFMLHGASVSLMPKFEPDEVLKVLEEERSTLFMAVPTMLKMMAEAPNFSSSQLSSMRYFIVGGEPMPIPLIEKWATKDIAIRQGFGMTEAGPNLTSLDHSDAIRKKGSIGTPNFFVETKLVNEKGEEVEVGEIGELLVKGPIVTPGYWQNEEATGKAIKDGWFYTGDLLKRDEEGYLFVMDRKKNMFISGGENVYPAELEHFFRSHEQISEVSVVGVPHPKWGEVGMAFVVPTPEGLLSEEELKAFCQGRLAKFKIPKHFHFVEELPKSATGKVDKKALYGLRLEKL